MKKSFTLIEILVASTIFIAMVVVGMATLTSVFNSRSKMTSLKNVQEAGRLGIKMIADEVKRANLNLNENVGGVTYYGFAIVDSAGIPYTVPDSAGRYTGHRLRVLQQTGIIKIFELWNETTGTIMTNGICPANNQCYVRIYHTTAGASRITAPDVNITTLNFVGYHQLNSSPDKKPYVTIQMTIQSRWQERASERERVTLRTTVSPHYLFSSMRLPYIFRGDFTHCDIDGPWGWRNPPPCPTGSSHLFDYCPPDSSSYFYFGCYYPGNIKGTDCYEWMLRYGDIKDECCFYMCITNPIEPLNPTSWSIE